jgi:hypothetical protein
MKFTALFSAAVVALTALAGCNHGGSKPVTGSAAKPANGGTASIDPCSLITTSEATAALGTQAKDGAPHAYQSMKQCEWDAAEGPVAGSVAILVYVGGQKARWPSTLAAAKQSPKFSDVQGLGDAAFTTGFDLHILKGDDMYQIGVAGPKDPLDRATAVAKQALARA